MSSRPCRWSEEEINALRVESEQELLLHVEMILGLAGNYVTLERNTLRSILDMAWSSAEIEKSS